MIINGIMACPWSHLLCASHHRVHFWPGFLNAFSIHPAHSWCQIEWESGLTAEAMTQQMKLGMRYVIMVCEQSRHRYSGRDSICMLKFFIQEQAMSYEAISTSTARFRTADKKKNVIHITESIALWTQHVIRVSLHVLLSFFQIFHIGRSAAWVDDSKPQHRCPWCAASHSWCWPSWWPYAHGRLWPSTMVSHLTPSLGMLYPTTHIWLTPKLLQVLFI